MNAPAPHDMLFSDRLDLDDQPWVGLDGPSVAMAAAALQLLPQNIPCLLRTQRLAAVGAALPARPQTRSLTPSGLRRLLREPVIDDDAVRQQEDSYDDIYVDEVFFQGGPKLVLQGLTSRSAHTLRQLFHAVYGTYGSRLPAAFKADVYDLSHTVLTLSDKICRSASLRRGVATEEWQARHVTVPRQAVLSVLTQSVVVDKEWLRRLLPVEKQHLVAPLIVQSGEHELRLGVGTDDGLILTPILDAGSRYIVANPGELAAALRHRILILSNFYGCRDALVGAFRSVAMAATTDLMLEWGIRPIDEPTQSTTNPVLLRRRFVGPASTTYDVCIATDDLKDFDENEPYGQWDVPHLGQVIQNLIDSPGPEEPQDRQTFRLIVTDGFARSTFYGLQDFRRAGPMLMASLDELATMIRLDGSDALFLWRFARADEALHRRSRVMTFSTLDTYAIYRGNESSFNLSDDRPPTMVSITAASGAPLRREAQRRWDSHHVVTPDGKTYVEVVSQYGVDTAPIYFLHPRHEQYVLVLELDDLKVWILSRPDSAGQAHMVISGAIEAAAYWLHQAATARPDMLAANATPTGQLLIYIGMDDPAAWSEVVAGTNVRAASNAPELEHQTWATSKERSQGVFEVTLHADRAASALSDDNLADRQLVQTLIGSFAKDSEPAQQQEFLDQIAPPGIKKMLHVFRASDVMARPTDVTARTVQSAVTSMLMDDLGAWLAETGWNRGPIPPEDATRALRATVEYYFQRLATTVATLSSDGLMSFLILQDEALLGRSTRQRQNLASQLACFGADSVKAADLMKDERKTVEASVASRFVIEFVAAQPPQGTTLIDLFIYDELLALSAEIVSRATLSDAIHYGFSDVQLSMLESGRLGVSRGDRYSAGVQEVAQAEAEAARALALGSGSLGAPDASTLGTANGPQSSTEPMIPRIDEAMAAEFGFTLTDLRLGLAELIALGDELEMEPCVASADDVRNRLVESLDWTEPKVGSFLAHMTLRPRQEFLSIGADAYPWKYNRDQAYIRRPLIVLAREAGRETFMWAARRTWHAGRYWTELVGAARIRARTRPMAKLMGSIRQAENDDFEIRVVDCLAKSGFSHVDGGLKSVGGHRLVSTDGHDLGDLDGLAVDPARKLILTAEAKDFELARTPVELAAETIDLVTGSKSAAFKLDRRTAWVRQNVDKVFKHFDIQAAPDGWTVTPVIVTSRNLVSPRVVQSSITVRCIDDLQSWASTLRGKPSARHKGASNKRRK